MVVVQALCTTSTNALYWQYKGFVPMIQHLYYDKVNNNVILGSKFPIKIGINKLKFPKKIGRNRLKYPKKIGKVFGDSFGNMYLCSDYPPKV